MIIAEEDLKSDYLQRLTDNLHSVPDWMNGGVHE